MKRSMSAVAIFSSLVSFNAMGKDQARAGAQQINDAYVYYTNSLSNSDDPDVLLAKEMCGFQVFTEWAGQYANVIKATPNLDIADVQPVSEMIVRLQKIHDNFGEAQQVFPDHYRKFNSAMSDLRSRGLIARDATQQGISLAEAKADLLTSALIDCKGDTFVNAATYHVDVSFWSQSMEYSSAKPGSIGVQWSMSGGYATYYVTPGEYSTATIKRSSFLRKALSL